MTARPMTILWRATPTDPAKPDRIALARAKERGPVIEMTAHPDDGGHRWGWYPATPEGLIRAGGAFGRLRGYGYRHPPVCKVGETVIPQAEIEVAVIVPFSRVEALRRAAALLRACGVVA